MVNLLQWKNWKKQEQLSIDEYKSLNSQYGGLGCVRAYTYPELTSKLIETNPINRALRQYISRKQNWIMLW